MTDDARPATVVEVERKFRVHGLYRLPDLVVAGAVGAVHDDGVVTLHATYFDTDDLRLAREGITLRRREGGEDAGWHLKLPKVVSGGAAAREELHLPLDAGSSEQPPIELTGLLAAIVRDDALRPVATLQTERRTLLLVPTDDDAATAASAPGGSVSGAGPADGNPANENAADENAAIENAASVDPADEDHAPDGPAAAPSSTDAATGSVNPVLALSDDVVSVLDADGTMAARFRELELEDLPGVDAVLAALVAERVAGVLVSAGAIAGEFVSKAVRALGPFAMAPPEVPEPAAVTPADPARDAIRAHFARHTRALRTADRNVRRDLDDAVHQARVAARRLRSGLKVFGPLLDAAWADELRAELGWLAGELGDYRDTEVLLARLTSHCDQLPAEVDAAAARAHVEAVLGARLAAARTRALEALDSKRTIDLHARLVTAAADPVTTERADAASAEVLPPLVTKAFRKLAKESERLLADEVRIPGGAPDEEWHATRITAKKARYAVEACAPVFGQPAAAFAKQLSRVTEVLGEHQDASIAQEQVHQVVLASTPEGTPASVEAAFALGALLAVEADSAQGTRTTYAEVWPQVSRPKWRRWLAT